MTESELMFGLHEFSTPCHIRKIIFIQWLLVFLFFIFSSSCDSFFTWNLKNREGTKEFGRLLSEKWPLGWCYYKKFRFFFLSPRVSNTSGQWLLYFICERASCVFVIKLQCPWFCFYSFVMERMKPWEYYYMSHCWGHLQTDHSPSFTRQLMIIQSS